MKQLAIVMLSACVAFAKPQQVSHGNNSPNIQHVRGSVSIIYIEQGPCTIPSDPSPNYAGGGVDSLNAPIFSAGSATISSSFPSNLVGSDSAISGTAALAPFNNVTVMADGRVNSAILVGAVTGSSTFDSSFSKTLVGSGSTITTIGALASFNNVTVTADGRVNGAILVGAVTGSSTLDSSSFSNTLVGSGSTITATGALAILVATVTGSATLDSSFFANTLVGSGSIITATGALAPFDNLTVMADSRVTGAMLAGRFTDSGTFVSSSFPTTLVASSSIISATDRLSSFKNVAYIADGHVNSAFLAGTVPGSMTFDSSSFPSALVDAGSITDTGALSPFKNVTDRADAHIASAILADAVTGGAPFALLSFPNTLVTSSSTITGTDNSSLSKALADLTARGKIITGWSLTYVPADPR